MRKGSKPCRLRPVGRMAGVRSRSPPGAGRTKRPSSARRRPAISWSSASSAVDRGQLVEQAQRARRRPACRPAASARCRRLARRPAPRPRRARAAGRARPRPSTAAGRRARRALGALPTTCRPCGISVYSSSSTASVERGDPARRPSSPQAGSAAASSSAAAWACISTASSARSAAASRLQAAAAVERGLQVDQAACTARPAPPAASGS